MKNVVVTGAARGIGRAIATRLAKDGFRVLVNYNRSIDAAQKTVEGIRKKGGVAESYRANVAIYPEVEKMIDYFCGKYGEINGLVLNAGIYIRKNIKEMSLEDWKNTIDVNLNGAMYPVKAALNCMKKGSIVFISSQLAFKGSKSSAAYSASKAGVLGLMRALSLQLAPEIRVNAVAPGTIDTDIIANYTPEMRRERERQIPLGRIGKPEDIADVVSFLLSEDSRYITGATIDVNGGLYIH